MQFTLNGLRYEDVRQNIVDWLTTRGEYAAEFDYQGSNLAYVIDSMAYTVMMLSYMISQVGNNVFLDTTEIRKNAVSIAKTIGYIPKRKSASRFAGTMRYVDETTVPSNATITIKPKSIWTSSGGNQYLNLDTVVFQKDPDPTRDYQMLADFVLVQGQLRRMEVPADGLPMQSILVPSLNVAADYLKVYVKNSADPDMNKVEWRHAKTFFDATEKEIFFVEEDRVNEGMPRVLFGNGYVGQIPTASQTIVIEWLETKGETANGETSFNVTDVANFETANITFSIDKIALPSLTSNGGSAIETLEEIQVNAPRYYAAAGRGVTANDYRTLGSEFKSIQYFNVIGGDELFPNDTTKLGNSYFTGVPYLVDDFLDNTKLYLTELEENEVLGKAKEMGIIATYKTFVKPTYIFLDVVPYIEHKQNMSAADILAIKDAVKANLEQHIKDRYSMPGVPFRYSKLQAAIDNTEGVISSYATVSYEFVLNYDSFYYTRENRCYLPVIAERKPDGTIIPGEYTNFVMTNSEIAAENGYSVTSLPVEMSSIYGKISHDTLNRHLYNSDAVQNNVYQIREFSNGTVSISTTPFINKDGLTIKPIVVQQSATEWGMYFSDSPLINRGTIMFDNDAVTITTLDIYDSYFEGHGMIKKAGAFFTAHKVISGSDVYWAVDMVIASNLSNILIYGKENLFQFTTSQTLVDGTLHALVPTPPFNTDGSVNADPTVNVIANSTAKWKADVDATYANNLPVAANGEVIRIIKGGTFENRDDLVENASKGVAVGEFLQLRSGKWYRAPVIGTLDATDNSSLPMGPLDGDVYTFDHPVQGLGTYLYDTALLPADPWVETVDTGIELNGAFGLPPQRTDYMHQVVVVESLITDTGSVAAYLGIQLDLDDILYFDGAAWLKATPTGIVDPLSIPGGPNALPAPSVATLGDVMSASDRGNFINYAASWFEGGVLPTVDLDDKLLCVYNGTSYVWRWVDPTDVSKNLDTRSVQNLPIEYVNGNTFEVMLNGAGTFEGYFEQTVPDGSIIIYNDGWYVQAVQTGDPPALEDGLVYQIVKKGTFGTATTYYPGDHIISHNSSWFKIEKFSAELSSTVGFEDFNADLVIDWVVVSGSPIYTVSILDTLHEVKIGLFNYLTGEVAFEQTVYEKLDMINTRSIEVKNIFNFYTDSHRMDTFRILPVLKANGDNETDFDTIFNQVVKARINSTRNKSELQ